MLMTLDSNFNQTKKKHILWLNYYENMIFDIKRKNLRWFCDLCKIDITRLRSILQYFSTRDSGVESFSGGVKGESFRTWPIFRHRKFPKRLAIRDNHRRQREKKKQERNYGEKWHHIVSLVFVLFLYYYYMRLCNMYVRLFIGFIFF